MPRSLALGLYLALVDIAGPVVRWVLRRRRAAGKEDPKRWRERLGRASAARPEGTLVWFHAASVGESVSLLAIIEDLIAQRPGTHVLLTTGTRTSAELMATRLPAGAVHQYVPMDGGAGVRRFLAHWRPDLAIWTESELWPQLVTTTARTGAPLLLLNARISPRSASRLRWLGNYSASLMDRFSRILAQDVDVATRLRRLGVDGARIEVAGSLKDTAEPLPHDKAALANLMKETSGRTVWLAASTHPGEEGIVAEANRAARRRFPGLLLILAPRHPERGPEIARMLRAVGCKVSCRSAGEKLDRNTEVYLADTLGEMGLWYRAAVASFVGGSLVPVGGHNPFEPALLGSAILTGPEIANFDSTYARFFEADAAVRVESAEDLAPRLIEALAPDRAAELATAAWEVSSEAADVRQRVLDVVLQALDPTA